MDKRWRTIPSSSLVFRIDGSINFDEPVKFLTFEEWDFIHKAYLVEKRTGV